MRHRVPVKVEGVSAYATVEVTGPEDAHVVRIEAKRFGREIPLHAMDHDLECEVLCWAHLMEGGQAQDEPETEVLPFEPPPCRWALRVAPGVSRHCDLVEGHQEGHRSGNLRWSAQAPSAFLMEG